MITRKIITHTGFTASWPARLLVLAVFSISGLSAAQATMNCADYLPKRYFERIDNAKKFAGKLVEQKDGTQQLQSLEGKVIIEGLTTAYVIMDKYVLAERPSRYGKKYGVVTAAGKVIVPFAYDTIHTEPDIGTSFIVSVHTSKGDVKQGVINRHGDWIYPLANAHIQHAHYDPDYDQDYFTVTNNQGLTGLLDDRGFWAIMPQYDAIHPLNACTGKPLYLQVSLQNKTALIDQNNEVIIAFAANQHIESFNNNVTPLLFLRSTLVTGSTATGMSEDIKDDIISAQIIDANGKVRLSSDAPITKLLYHQHYTYKQAGKYGIIDDQSHTLLTPQFDSYRDEADSVWVEKQGKMVRLDTLLKLD